PLPGGIAIPAAGVGTPPRRYRDTCRGGRDPSPDASQYLPRGPGPLPEVALDLPARVGTPPRRVAAREDLRDRVPRLGIAGGARANCSPEAIAPHRGALPAVVLALRAAASALAPERAGAAEELPLEWTAADGCPDRAQGVEYLRRCLGDRATTSRELGTARVRTP